MSFVTTVIDTLKHQEKIKIKQANHSRITRESSTRVTCGLVKPSMLIPFTSIKRSPTQNNVAKHKKKGVQLLWRTKGTEVDSRKDFTAKMLRLHA